jgi:uncharacterized protein YhfF
MHFTPEIEAFWQSYLISLPQTERLKLHLASVSDFGDSPELADELAQLIQAGVKSATSGDCPSDGRVRPEGIGVGSQTL